MKTIKISKKICQRTPILDRGKKSKQFPIVGLNKGERFTQLPLNK